MGQLRASLCAALMGIATSTSAFSFPPFELLERASTCKNANDIPCNQGLPSNFCCQSTTICLVLAGNTTALCCPTGQSCSQIQAISCDITLQNATAHPENALKTTDLSGTLPSCGSNCCPFGYTCSSDNTTCIEDSNQSLAPGETASSSTSSKPISSSSTSSHSTASSVPASTSSSLRSTTSTIATVTTIPTPTTALEGAATTSVATTPVSKHPSFSAGAFLAGFFPGIVAGILLSIASFCIYGARRRRQGKRLSGASSFANGVNVSDPIYNSSSAVRTDFLRKQTQTPSLNEPSTPRLGHTPTLKRMAGFVRKSMHMNNSGNSGYGNTNPMTAVPRRAPLPPMTTAPPPTNLPQTPKMQRAESGVSISVFAGSDISTPPTTAPLNILKIPMQRESHQTTVDDFMNHSAERADLAGLRKGEPFIQQPAYGNYTHERKGSKGRNLTPKRQEGI